MVKHFNIRSERMKKIIDLTFWAGRKTVPSLDNIFLILSRSMDFGTLTSQMKELGCEIDDKMFRYGAGDVVTTNNSGKFMVMSLNGSNAKFLAKRFPVTIPMLLKILSTPKRLRDNIFITHDDTVLNLSHGEYTVYKLREDHGSTFGDYKEIKLDKETAVCPKSKYFFEEKSVKEYLSKTSEETKPMPSFDLKKNRPGRTSEDGFEVFKGDFCTVCYINPDSGFWNLGSRNEFVSLKNEQVLFKEHDNALKWATDRNAELNRYKTQDGKEMEPNTVCFSIPEVITGYYNPQEVKRSKQTIKKGERLYFDYNEAQKVMYKELKEFGKKNGSAKKRSLGCGYSFNYEPDFSGVEIETSYDNINITEAELKRMLKRIKKYKNAKQ